FGLCEIGNFRRAADVGNRWEKEILHDRAEKGVRAEIFRLAANRIQNLLLAPGPVARFKFSIAIGDHLPAVRRDMKEDSAARSDSHLRSVASVLQLFVALQQRFVDGIALFHSTGKKRLGHAVQAKIERIEQNQPGLFQQTCKKLAESASVGF